MSVILPTLNRSSSVRRAIESVQQQAVEEWELIVVDDASTEDLHSVVASVGDERVRHRRTEVNLGVAGAQNYGLASARGEFVAFLHSDDRWLPHKLEVEIELLEKAPSNVCGVESAALVGGQRVIAPRLRGIDAEQLLGFQAGVQIVPFLFRRQVLDRNPFDSRLRAWEDWDLLVRLLRHHTFRFVDTPTVEIGTAESDRLSTSRAMLDALEILKSKYAADLHEDAGLRYRWNFKLFRASLNMADGAKARRYLLQAYTADPRKLKLLPLLGASVLGLRSVKAAWDLYQKLGSIRVTKSGTD